MSEDLKEDAGSTQPREESEVVMLIKQVQQQMVYLEKKLDLLLAQAPQKSFKESSFPRPRRSFGNSFHHEKGRPQHSRHGAGGFSHDRSTYDRPQGNTNYTPFPSKERFFGKKRERKTH